MKQNKVTNISKNVRKFWITTCTQCGNVDAAVEQLKEYNATRDLAEWNKEGRKVTEFIQINKAPIRWCRCSFEDEIVEE